MHPELEKLEQQFVLFQKDPSNEIAFFSNQWLSLLSLPRPEVNTFCNNIYSWANENKSIHPKLFALATFTLGFINFHSEKYEDALKYVGLAEKLFSEIGDDDGIALCNCSNGGTYRALGNLELALKYLMQGFHQLSKSNVYPLFETIASYALASTYMDLNNFEKAIEAYKICIEISSKFGNRNFEMLSFTSLGEAYHKLKEDELAYSYFEKALKLGKALDHKSNYSRVLTDLGEFYYDCYDVEKALACNQEALALRESLKIQGGVVTNQLMSAKIYRKQGKNEAAIMILERALILAEEIKIKPKIFQIHLRLSEIYEQMGELERSLNHYKIYQRISEEVYKEDGIVKLKRSEQIFEAEQTKKENEIIKAQKKLIEKTNIELQKTIDELSLSKINRKAKAITITIAIILFIIEDSILHYVVAPKTHDNFFISLAANFSVVFCIKPIEKIVEHYLIHRFVKINKEYEVLTH